MSEPDFSDQALNEETPAAPDTPEEGPSKAEQERAQIGSIVDDQEGETLLAGKYRNPEELERAHVELMNLQGRQTEELGQLRQAVEALNQPDYQPSDAPLPTDETMDAIGELVDSGRMNWQEAVQWAGTQSPHLYEQTMRAWFDDDPYTATQYSTANIVEQRQAQLAREVSPYLAQQEEQQTANRVLETWRNMAGKYPDFNDVGAQISEQLGANPELASSAASTDPATRERAFETLYVLARHSAQAAGAPPPQQASPPVNAAKTAAQVVTASSTQTRGDTGRQQQINAYLDRMLGGGLSVESGLEKP